MANIEINVTENGTTTLATAGKYCDRNIDVVVEVAGGGGEEYFTDEDLVFTGNLDSLFSYDKWETVLEKERDRIKIVNPNNLNNFLRGSTGIDYSYLNIEGDGKTACNCSQLISGMDNIEKFPVLKNIVLNANLSSYLIYDLKYFTNVDELVKFFDNVTFNNSVFQHLGLFSNCYSLRNIDTVMPYLKKALVNYKNGAGYNGCFNNLYFLDELNNIPVMMGTRTYNGFSSAFNNPSRVKSLTFDTDNGAPYVVQWKGQTIDLSYGYGIGTLSTSYLSYLATYNSGITEDKRVTDDVTYQALKNDADWFTTNVDYSRYNHDSAVNTINSLPDTSAYLATAGGTNTIKFKGASGSKTDGGAINTLTEAEIAVAAAKGWTVTLV